MMGYERLAAGLLGFKMHPIIYTLGIGGELPKEMYTGGEKFGMVLKGKIEFLYDKEKMIFEKGEANEKCRLHHPTRRKAESEETHQGAKRASAKIL